VTGTSIKVNYKWWSISSETLHWPLISHFIFYSSTHALPELEVYTLKVLNMQLNYEAEVLGDSVCWIIQELWVKKTCYVRNLVFFWGGGKRTTSCVIELEDNNKLICFCQIQKIFYLPYGLLYSVIRLSSGHLYIKFKTGKTFMCTKCNLCYILYRMSQE